MEERNLDGAYFRVNRDGKWKNICFSDLTKEERARVMEGKSEKFLASLCEHLADQLRSIGDELNISMQGGEENGDDE